MNEGQSEHATQLMKGIFWYTVHDEIVKFVHEDELILYKANSIYDDKRTPRGVCCQDLNQSSNIEVDIKWKGNSKAKQYND